MAGIINLSINLSKIPKEKYIKGKNGTYANITIALNDETKFGNNVSSWVSQPKEDTSDRAYLGNGRVVWTDGKISLAEVDSVENKEQPELPKLADDDLPF